jgi:hypothetical protein
MAGFGAALQAFGQVRMQQAADKRAEKMDMLRLQFAADEAEKGRTLQREEGAASRAIQKEQLESTKAYQNASLAAQERIATSGNTTQLAVANLSAETQKTLQQMQIDAGKKPELVNTDQGPQWVLYSGGKVTHVPAPINEETGKPYEPVIGDGDTPQEANLKALITVYQVPKDQALKMVFPEAATSKAKTFSERVFEYNQRILSNTMIPANTENAPDTAAAARSLALNDGGLQEGEVAGAPAAATDPAAATTPAVTLTPTQKEAAIAKAKELISQGLSRRVIVDRLKENGFTPAEITAAGI